MNRTILILLISHFCCWSQNTLENHQDLKLWYEQAATRWLEALPIGNGNVGAMVFGGIERERIALNISTLWSGAPSKNSIPTSEKYLKPVRELLFDQRYGEAEELIEKHFLGKKNTYGTHLPLGDLYIDFRHNGSNVKNYRRELDINSAISTISYELDGVHFTREMFASNPDGLIVMKMQATQPSALSFTLGVDCGDLPHTVKTSNGNVLNIKGSARENLHSDGKTGVNFSSMVKISETDGVITANEKGLTLSDAQYAILYIAINTDYLGMDPHKSGIALLREKKSMTYPTLKKRHTEDYQNLFDRVKMKLGDKGDARLPTDKRLLALKRNPDDDGLYTLFYQYGRYLLIASSRENSVLPANLQGIWNDNGASTMPWTCDFHLDINTQQNYWPTFSGNLWECSEPLYRFLQNLQESGQETAKEMYGADGWVAHVFTNAWGYTSPGWGMGWGLHVTGGAWIASHLWYQYQYSGDEEFLRDRAYPILKGAATFFLEYMVEYPELGYLVTGPSLSPENKFIANDGTLLSETMGPTCDVVLVKDLFNFCISASKILNIDPDFRRRLQHSIERLPPLQISENGQLQEWLHDYEDGVPNHRHTSHLIALYPSEQITLEKTPELAQAATITLTRRLEQPDWEDVEWSRGNLINFYARLKDSEKAYSNLTGLLTENTDFNMMTFSRAGIAGASQNIFAMDGNTSGANGIAEMLFQSYDNTIYLLPSLPKAWTTGSIKGLLAKGGFSLDFSWNDGELTDLKIKSLNGNPCIVSYGGKSVVLSTEEGRTYHFNGKLKSAN